MKTSIVTGEASSSLASQGKWLSPHVCCTGVRNRVWMPRTHRSAGWARWAGMVGLQQRLWCQPHRGAKQEPWCTLAENQHGVSSGFSFSFIRLSLEFLNMIIGSLFLLFLEICYYIYLGAGSCVYELQVTRGSQRTTCSWFFATVWVPGTMLRSSGLTGSTLTCWASLPAQLIWSDCENLPQRMRWSIRLVLTHSHASACTLAQAHTRAGIPHVHTHEKRKQNVSKTGKNTRKPENVILETWLLKIITTTLWKWQKNMERRVYA